MSHRKERCNVSKKEKARTQEQPQNEALKPQSPAPKPEPVPVLKECQSALSDLLKQGLLVDKPVRQRVGEVLARGKAALEGV